MNIEGLHEYCISLEAVEEKFPFAKMKGGESVLVFYVCNHMFALVDLNEGDIVNVESASRTEYLICGIIMNGQTKHRT